MNEQLQREWVIQGQSLGEICEALAELRLQNVGQRARHDTPFLLLFRTDILFKKSASLWSLFRVCVKSVRVYLLREKVQPVPKFGDSEVCYRS